MPVHAVHCSTAVCVYGANEAAVFAALAAAGAGAEVTLVGPRGYLFGVLPSLGAWETHYPGVRSPLTRAFREAVLEHYATVFGHESDQFRTCARLEDNNPMVTFEPHVAEGILDEWLRRAPGLAVRAGYVASSVEIVDRRIARADFLRRESGEMLRIEAPVFIDASFEGDLAALAGVPWRLGRESRGEYGETHAGKVFSRYTPGKFPWEAVHGRLNLIPKWSTLGLMAGSTGEGDDRIQAYGYRLCLTDDPANRLVPASPPDDYDPERFLGILEDPTKGSTRPCPLHHRFMLNTLQDMVAGDHLIHGHQLPNRKRSWNATNYTGAGRGYATADEAGRRAIERRHLDHALGILWFLQHEPRIPSGIRERAREWGLARDEFSSHGNVPPQLYVREARRIRGRHTLTEHDCTLAPSLERAPVFADSIAITEFPIDSLDCSTERRPGTMNDGQFFLMEYSRPGQVPYRCLLPEDLDNLLVPVAASVSHVAWGTYRQNPTLLHISESAGVAAALAARSGVVAASLDPSGLQRELLRRGVLIAFFNDIDMATDAPWLEAVQFWAARGFFPDYNARGDEVVEQSVARLWLTAAREEKAGVLTDPTGLARQILKAWRADAAPLGLAEWRDLMREHEIDGEAGHSVPTRGELCRMLYERAARPQPAAIAAAG